MTVKINPPQNAKTNSPCKESTNEKKYTKNDKNAQNWAWKRLLNTDKYYSEKLIRLDRKVNIVMTFHEK